MQEKDEILTKLKGWDEEIAWKKYAAAVLKRNGGVKNPPGTRLVMRG